LARNLVGSDEEVLAKLPEDDPSTDLQGQTMVPGILDAHGHFPGEVFRDLAGYGQRWPIQQRLLGVSASYRF
jgi:predicted amidohydrolase YtcJ